MVDATIAGLYRYPVKGLSAERLSEVWVEAGETLPFDRAYAIENGPGAFDEAAPRHLPKVAFLCLMRDERLAALRTVYDGDTLTISRDGKVLASGALGTANGRAAIEGFIARELATELRGRPRVVSAPGHSFSDVKEKCLHIINLASVRALEQSTGGAIDPMRFRANVLIDGLEPWAELGLLGREVTLGTARGLVFKRTVRCAATNVDPANGLRGGDLPDEIFRAHGHRDFGIYATVTRGGIMRTGDTFEIT
ncbi:MAG: MOSC domain-containing protein [Hyphomicrobiaceae bacterium]